MGASRGETEGLGVVAAIVVVVAGLTAVRYAPWALAAALAAIVVALLTPRALAGKAALCALAVAAIATPLAAIAVASDYQHTTTRQGPSPPRRPTAAAARRRSASDASSDRARKASHAPLTGRRVIERSGFLSAWNPSHGLLGPFHPSALKRWWALTASVTIALAALLSAALLGAGAIYHRRRPPPARHASWPRVGQSSRTWRPS